VDGRPSNKDNGTLYGLAMDGMKYEIHTCGAYQWTWSKKERGKI